MSALEGLNEAQALAVAAGDGPLSIVAGPGTGKTKTLTARIVQLVENGTAPERILALTFTNKAAREMQSRISMALQGITPPKPDDANKRAEAPQTAQNDTKTPTANNAPALRASSVLFEAPAATAPQITTFHGLCYELLNDGTPLHIISEADRLELLRELRSQYTNELPLREIAAKISLAKNSTEHIKDPTILVLLDKYNAALREQNRVDFDDLLQEVYQRLSNDQTFRANVQSRWRYILVDEFQDTNELQYALFKLLASHDNFFAIGDPLQSIYGFRGAAGDIFRRFNGDFPNAQNITLTMNYRSTPEIVAASNELFKDAPKLAAQNQTPGVVEVVEVLNEYREADWIVQSIEADLGGTDFQRSHKVSGNERARKFSDYAVLYRTHRVARVLKRAFEQSGIPFQSVGDDSPYASRTLRTAIAVLHRSAYGVESLAPDENRLLAKLPRKALDDLKSQTTLPPTKFLELAAKELSLIKDDENQREFHQMLGSLVRFDRLGTEDFLLKFDELAEADFFDSNAEAVTLMTIHASKGLEFAHVFVIAAEDGVLPHVPKEATPKKPRDVPLPQASDVVQTGQTSAPAGVSLEEEKRLLYVAMTRAREQLTILHARTRGGQLAKISPFFDEIPTAILPRSLDPNLQMQAIAAQKRKAKNSQVGLF